MPKFEVVSEYTPSGDQPQAIEALSQGIEMGLDEQTLLGVTGSGKTFTMAKIIEQVQRPTLVLAHNKTLAAQLCAEFKEFFPNNAVEYFVSYYDYYQPEAYIPHTDTFIEKDSAINEEIDRLRLSATASLLERRDVIVVSSVSCIYGLGEPEDFAKMMVSLRVGDILERDEFLKRLVSIRYERNDIAFERNMFRVRGDTVEVWPAYWKDTAIRVEFFGDEIDRISEINVVTGSPIRKLSHIPIWPATHYVTPKEKMDAAVQEIYKELEERVAYFEKEGKLIEAQRIQQRTNYDMEMLQEVGVEVLLYVFCADIVKNGDAVEGVVVESKAGREAILAKTVIDCTGDGDVACRAGVECRKGDADGGMQPPTLMFCMKGVDVQKLRDALVGRPDVFDMDTMPAEQFRTGKFITVGLRNQIRKAEEAGYKIPVARTILITGIKDDEIWVNMSRVSGVDSTKPESYTHGEVEGRKQIYELERYLKNFVPGFENAWREKVAPFMGIRESRVIVGKYILTAEDILACRRFDDAVAVASYPVDIHHATGGDCTLHWCEDCYDIPYRSLVPAAVENLLVAGRCSSMNHEAMASTRVMSTCMALGEAAGRAARIALEEGVRPSAVDVEKVREELRQTGAYLR